MEEKKHFRTILLLPVLACSLLACQKTGELPETTPNSAYFVRVDKDTKNATLRVLSKSEEIYFAEAGDLLFINAVLDNGYVLDHFLLNGEAIEGSSFTMPEKDVTIGISLHHVTNPISIDSFDHGKIEVDKEKAAYGESVNITVTPNEGYYCYPNSLKINNHVVYRSPIYEMTTFSFLMPSVAITIHASFMERGTL